VAYAVVVNVLRIEVVMVRTEARENTVDEEEPRIIVELPAGVEAAAVSPALELLLTPGIDEAGDG
jgi:hypothetical protein